jgi:CysZ protein
MTGSADEPPFGFWRGAGALFGGMGFIVRRPAMWGWALVPAVVATALFLGFGALAAWAGSDLANRVLGELGGGAWATAGAWALRMVLGLVGAVVAFLLAISLAQPLSGFALDAIARRQAIALGGGAWPDQPALRSAVRSLGVALAALAISVPVLALLTLVTMLFPPASVVTIPLKFGVTGLAVAYDLLDYPLSLRGEGVRSRMAFFRRHFLAVLGFGLAAALLLLVPGVGLLLLPFGVAGAARIVVATDPRAKPETT